MIMKRVLLTAGMAALLPTAAWAANDCTALAPRLERSPVSFGYDPFDATDTTRDFQIEIRSDECPESRNIFLEIGSSDPAVSDGHLITAFGPGGTTIQVMVSDREANNGGGRGDIFNVKKGMQSLYAIVERGQVVPPGTYRAPLLAIERLDNGHNVSDVSTPFDLIITVGAAVGLAPAIGAEINLGELANNDTAANAVSFDAYANVDYELEILSDQSYQLRLTNSPSTQIGYVPLLDNASVETGNPRRNFLRPLGTDSRRRHTLNVRVPSIAGRPAGEYADVLTVQISAKIGG